MPKTLSVKLKVDSKSAENSLGRVLTKIENINSAMNKTSTASTKIATHLNKLSTNANKVKQSIDKTNSSAAKMKKEIRGSSEAMNGLYKKAAQLTTVLFGIQGMRKAIETSDTITGAQNKLNAINADKLGAKGYDASGGYSDAAKNMTQDSLAKMYDAANRSRYGYTDMMANVSKSMTLAPDAFKGNIDNAIKFQEVMAKSYAVGGASAAEASSSMYQLIQALGSGKLSGDELKSVTKGAPLAANAIEEYAQKVYNTTDSLKELGSQGKITSEMVVAAMMNAGDIIEKKFNASAMTIGQAFNLIKNSAVEAFRPVSEEFNKLLNSENGRKAIEGLCNALRFLGEVALGLMKVFGIVFNFIVENWWWIQVVVYGVLAVIIAIVITLMITHIQAAITAAAAWMVTNAAMLQTVFIIVLIILALYLLLTHFDIVFGFICGIVLAALAFVANIFISVLNMMMQGLWSIFVEPMAGIVEWVVNAFTGGFDSMGAAFLNFCGQLLSALVGLLKPFAALLDFIFGWDINGSISEAQASMRSWGKNGSATTFKVAAPPQIKKIDVGAAYDTGYNWGKSVGGDVSNFVSGLFGGDGNTDLNEVINNQLNLDDYSDIANGGVGKKTAGNTGKTADNTKKMADLQEEDLKYLRELAERDWKKEFTTATITVDMSNYNTINGENDLDGIVTKLTSKLYEELSEVANGVYV